MRRWLLLILLLAGAASAATTGVVDSSSFTPTFHNIGGKLFFTGDDDSNAVVRMLVKKSGGATFDTCLAPVRVGWASPKFYATSALDCGQDTAYTVRFEWSDATETWARDTTITTTGPFARAVTGKQVWVSPTGSDANSGLSSSLPKLTLTAALTAATTAGDQIRVMAGITYDTLDVANTKDGTRVAPRSIVGEPGAIISGADPTLISAAWDSVNVNPPQGATRKIYCKRFASPAYPRIVIADSTRRLFSYGTLSGLAADSMNVGDGFYVSANGDTLYVYLNGESPNGRVMQVPKHNSLVTLKASWWWVDSLQFRCVGLGRDVGISFGAVQTSGRQNQIRNSYFYNLARPAVCVRLFFGNVAPSPDRTFIDGNTFRDWRVGTPYTGPMGEWWGYAKTTASVWTEYNQQHPVIILEHGIATTISNNTVSGMVDGFPRWSTSAIDSTRVDDTDVLNNYVENISSDVFEPDACTCVNVRIRGNTVYGGNSGLQSSAFRGPLFMYRNTFVDQNGLLLPSLGFDTLTVGQCSIAHTLIFNNTHWSKRGAAVAMSSPQSGRYEHYNLFNNVLAANGTGEILWEQGYPTPATIKNQYNYNAFDGSGVTTTAFAHIVGWAASATILTLPDSTGLRNATSWQKDGFVAFPAQPLLYADTLHRTFAPVASSPLLGKQRTAPGVTTNFANHTPPGFVALSAIGAWNVDNVRPDDPVLAVSTTGARSATLTFTATGTDSLTGCASTYEVRHSAAGAITDANWGAATSDGTTSIGCAGSPETFTVTGLSQSTQYWFAVRVTDYSAVVSAASNSPTTTTRKKGWHEAH